MQREHQDERLRDEHHPEIHLEAGPDVGQRQREAVRIEERVEDLLQRVHAYASTSGPESSRS